MRSYTFRKILVIFLLVFVVVLLNNYVLGHFLQNWFYKLAARPGTFLFESTLGLSRFSNSFFKTAAIVDENTKLKEENLSLVSKVAELEGLKRENNFLKDELSVAKGVEQKLVLVKVFDVHRDVLASTALINRGKSAGIRESMPVIGAGGILAGVVDQVFDNSAAVLFLDDPRSTVGARIQGTNILAETKGISNNDFSLNLVTARDQVQEGDTVVTSGLDGLPESLVIGRIAKVEVDSGGLFKKVLGQSLFDLSLGSNLFVILTQVK